MVAGAGGRRAGDVPARHRPADRGRVRALRDLELRPARAGGRSTTSGTGRTRRTTGSASGPPGTSAAVRELNVRDTKLYVRQGAGRRVADVPVASNWARGTGRSRRSARNSAGSTGSTAARFREQTGFDLDELLGGRLAGLVAEGLLSDDGVSVRLTRRGKCVADGVIEELMKANDGRQRGGVRPTKCDRRADTAQCGSSPRAAPSGDAVKRRHAPFRSRLHQHHPLAVAQRDAASPPGRACRSRSPPGSCRRAGASSPSRRSASRSPRPRAYDSGLYSTSAFVVLPAEHLVRPAPRSPGPGRSRTSSSPPAGGPTFTAAAGIQCCDHGADGLYPPKNISIVRSGSASR